MIVGIRILQDVLPADGLSMSIIIMEAINKAVLKDKTILAQIRDLERRQINLFQVGTLFD
jgi:hypothetical protein